jgi:hypothetical protein
MDGKRRVHGGLDLQNSISSITFPISTHTLWKVGMEPEGKDFRLDDNVKKILPADNLALRGMQHNPLCPLCNYFPKDARHFIINCTFANEVTRFMWNWCHFQGLPLACPLNLELASWLHANAARADL